MARKMKTNDLRFTDSRIDRKGNQWEISICLNDKCKNGHQDFSLTGTCYEDGKRKTDRNMITCGACGACGDEIALLFPEYAIFNNLHLCDYLGIPVCCAGNGYYFLQHGFNRYEEGENLKSTFCKYYRVTEKQFDFLSCAKSKVHYAILLEENGIFEQWKEEADKAIKKLEELTGNEFVVDSVRTQYDKPSADEITAERNKIKNGYYSPESEAKREKEAESKELQNIDNEENEKIAKIKEEYNIKRIMFSAGKKAYENYIYYDYTKQIAFNWRGYNDITEQEIKDAKELVIDKLPNGVTFK